MKQRTNTSSKEQINENNSYGNQRASSALSIQFVDGGDQALSATI